MYDATSDRHDPNHMSTPSIQQQDQKTLRKAELEALDVIDFGTLEEIFDEWMLLPDRHVLKFLVACYCANELSQRPVWAGMIAPSGGGKTELLNSLNELPKIYSVSLITPNTFLSGMPGARDTSLLPKVSGKILVFKDWTSILSMQRDARAELFGQFREIHDGGLRKEFGNGQSREWKGKVSIIFACTEAVDINQQQYTHLGERFIYYRPVMPNRKEVARRSLKNSAKQEAMTHALQDAMYAFLKGIDFAKYTDLPELPPDVQEELVFLSNFCTMARSGVIRDLGPRKDVIFVPTAEMPTRILQQLSLLGSGAMIANGGHVLPEDIEMLYKVALDSIPRTNKIVIQEMAKGDRQSTASIATALGYPTDTIRIYLENLALLGVCTRHKETGKSDSWTMQPEFVSIIHRYEKIQQLSEEALKGREDAAKSPEDLEAERMWNSLPDGPAQGA